jgi:adenine deaminase
LIVPERDVVLAGVTMANPGLERREGQRITIQGSTIASISADVDRPAVAHQYPGTYVLPGLIDMHVHHPPARAVLDTQLFALLYLAHGVTTVRDTAPIFDRAAATW